MGTLSTALVVASETAAAEGGTTPAWIFGAFAFGTLVVALIVTTMINVNR